MNNLIDIYEWWFYNNKSWFDSSTENDYKISIIFKSIINKDFNINDNITKKEGLGYIILKDQILRHYVRNFSLDKKCIDDNLNELLKFVNLFYNKFKEDLFGYEFCFTLLPYRHTNNYDSILFAINECWNKIFIDKNNIDIYKKFLKASYERMNFNNLNLLYKKEDSVEKINNEHIFNKFKEILDKKCFLKNNSNIEFLEIYKYFELIKDQKIILSISGGVDSMILSFILNKLKINFEMFHLNYNNRDSCNDEKKLLIEWAKLLNVNFYCRDLHEIQREKCMDINMRQIYENYTRNVRYSCYQELSDNNLIMLGHNKDYCFENILTNIASKNKYDNLNAMEFISIINFNNKNIKFVRPLLEITKDYIYEYANYYKIPFLLDSTPSWSQRGQIRDIIKPTLNKWNSNIINGFEEVSIILKESIECVKILTNNLILKIDDIINLDNLSKPKNLIINDNDKFLKFKKNELIFNKIIWIDIFKNLNIKITNKCLLEFIIRLKNINKQDINKISKFELSKNNKIYYWITKNKHIIILFLF